MRLNSKMNIQQIEQKINKKNQKSHKIISFFDDICLPRIFKILNNGCRQGPSFNLSLNHPKIKKKRKDPKCIIIMML